MNKQRLIIGLSILFVIAIGFVLAGLKQGYFTNPREGVLTISVPPTLTLPGEIISVNDDHIVLAVRDGLEHEEELKERVVRINTSTKILKEGAKRDADVYALETAQSIEELALLTKEEFDARVAESPAPEQYVLEEVSLKDLVVGMIVIVSVDHDIEGEKEFNATKIRIPHKSQE